MTLLVLAMAITTPAAGLAQSQTAGNGVNWSHVAYGAGSALASLVYFPVKAAYAILGGIVGGGAYLATVGNMQVADQIWRASMGGDYVVTPSMLEGRQSLHFSGT
ncbi:MAG: hypothetical protein ACREQ4_04380 [Candidatus Binataceae bacterium]